MVLSLKHMIQSSMTDSGNWSVSIKCLHIKQVRYGAMKLRLSITRVKLCRALRGISCLSPLRQHLCLSTLKVLFQQKRLSSI